MSAEPPATSRRPVIGLCAAVDQAELEGWRHEAVMLPRSYPAAVQHAGGLALMLPPDEWLAERPDEVLDLLDGLLLAGGCDIDPGTYGAQAHTETGETSTVRDDFEVALARRALERDIPMLGICRGMQLLNVATGGTLKQHLPDEVGHDDHRRAPHGFADHEVSLHTGSLARRAAGEERHPVRSWHHQGPDRIAEGVTVTGHSELDGTPEAIEVPGRRFALGVLWHPEEDEASRVIGALVDEARESAQARAA